jgi:hypothetical protein
MTLKRELTLRRRNEHRHQGDSLIAHPSPAEGRSVSRSRPYCLTPFVSFQKSRRAQSSAGLLLGYAAMMTERQLTAIERARHERARFVVIVDRHERRRSHTAAELLVMCQGHWADRERERLVWTWDGSQ